MRAFTRQLVPSVVALLAFTVLCGIVYPLVVTGIAQVLWHDKANGSLVKRDGVVVGSSLIGQPFSAAKYFHPPPSDNNGRSLVNSNTNPIRVVEHQADEPIEPLALEKMSVD